MSSSRRKLRRVKTRMNRVKIHDDKSGFNIWADDARIDQDGIVSSSTNFDPVHPSEMMIEMPVDTGEVPFKRPEGAEEFLPDSFTWSTSELWTTTKKWSDVL